MDIVVVVTDQHTTHEGVVRPFVNLAKALCGKHRFRFLLFNCSSDFSDQLAAQTDVVVCKNRAQLSKEVVQLKPDCVLSDDSLNRLRIAQEIRAKTGAKTAAYTQILFGSHCIAGCFDLTHLSVKQKIIFTPFSYLPFSWLRNKYTSLISRSDLVIANSKITASFLHSLYNVEVSGIVYPPVDNRVFYSSNSAKHSDVTIYLGSHLGDTKQAFAAKIVEAAHMGGCKVNLFGNRKIATYILKKHSENTIYHSNLSDAELAQLYQTSKLTVCPQKWEQFGYVPVESIACGTPVLAFNCMGFQETITGGTGYLANNEAELLQTLKEAINNPQAQVSHLAIEPFSMKCCGESFERLLEKHFSALP